MTEKNKEIKHILRIVSGVLLCLFSLYTIVVFISYLFTWNADQSLLQRPADTPLVEAANQGGTLGFRWSHLLIGRYFGLAAFFIPFLIFLAGGWCLKIKRLPLLKGFIVALTGLVLFSVLFGFVFGYTPWKALFGNGLGGAHGFHISRWLVVSLGIAGAALLLLFLLLLWCIVIDRRIVTSFMCKPKEEGVVEIKEVRGVKEDGGDGESDDESNDVDVAKQEEDTITFEVVEKEDEEEYKENKEEELFDPTLELSGYKRPLLDLLDEHKSAVAKVSEAELEKNKEKIKKTLSDYKIGIDKIIATIGPTVTLYEIVPQAGVRISSIKRLEDDIALSLKALGVRIIAPIPGKGTVGIEVPNEHPETVSMLSVMRSAKFQESKFDLPVVLGKTIADEIYMFDLAKMPHLLVAGATGQGKSVGLNAILTSLLYRKHPAELKLVLVDPKKVELSLYAKIERHFLAKLPDEEEAIITDTQKVVYTLKSLCQEMDGRYDLLKAAQVRNIKEYNEKFFQHRLNPLKGHRYLPFIVVVIDEFADLLMTAGRELEEPIARLAQKARAIGIHLVIATQRPTTNVITGLIKANFTARIAFRVISSIDSRTILDTTGANQLIGRGDMLVSTGGEMTRVQCAFVDTPEVEKLCEYIGAQRGYEHALYLPEYSGEENSSGNGSADVDLDRRDKMFDEAARIIVQHQQGSTSLLQRKLNLGYNRAGRLMDQLEKAGIVGPFEGSKARQVLYTDMDSLAKRLKEFGSLD
ncbi:MAG: DNA translocase FtsK [Prevotellaceae bacterium]|jgi:S-DNA-T family DNA segregation ATPase FtsK/SpoIIIE|nr:DNA translocase FtsK [Prevotellaceae bacterium]